MGKNGIPKWKVRLKKEDNEKTLEEKVKEDRKNDLTTNASKKKRQDTKDKKEGPKDMIDTDIIMYDRRSNKKNYLKVKQN